MVNVEEPAPAAEGNNIAAGANDEVDAAGSAKVTLGAE